jgi:hypothetical protein
MRSGWVDEGVPGSARDPTANGYGPRAGDQQTRRVLHWVGRLGPGVSSTARGQLLDSNCFEPSWGTQVGNGPRKLLRPQRSSRFPVEPRRTWWPHNDPGR